VAGLGEGPCTAQEAAVLDRGDGTATGGPGTIVMGGAVKTV
jgi:hypothetical protein